MNPPLPFGFMPRENTIVALHGSEYIRLEIQHARDLLADLAAEEFAACSCHRRAAIKRNAACLAKAINAFDGRQLELAQMARNTKEEPLMHPDKIFIWINGARTSLTALAAMDKADIITVYASGCTALTTLDAPEAGYVDASGCTALTALRAPKATTVDARGCGALTALRAPKATTVYASGCTALTTLDAPEAGYVYASGCTALTALRAPKATTVYARGCTALTSLRAPKATTVYARGCTALTTLDAPEAGYVDASGCTALTAFQTINVGENERGYKMWAVNLHGSWRIIAGCRNFSINEARAHWGAKSPRAHAGILARVGKDRGGNRGS